MVVGGADRVGRSTASPGVAGARVRRAARRPADRRTTGPSVDERDAAALCYTSGTTGNPKGVVYSHRSIWLHSMQVCATEAFGLPPGDSALAVVPQFHAMAWGLPYAAFMTGASLLMPDRFLQAEPLAG